jgi:hypothetical protein
MAATSDFARRVASARGASPAGIRDLLLTAHLSSGAIDAINFLALGSLHAS